MSKLKPPPGLELETSETDIDPAQDQTFNPDSNSNPNNASSVLSSDTANTVHPQMAIVEESAIASSYNLKYEDIEQSTELDNMFLDGGGMSNSGDQDDSDTNFPSGLLSLDSNPYV